MENKGEKFTYPNFDKMYLELKNAGYPDINDFKTGNEYSNALKTAYGDLESFIKIVIKWIPRLEYKVGGVLLLQATDKRYDGRVLIPIFNESSKQDRWRICDAIEHNPPLYINDWVECVYLDKQYDYFETGLLPLAVAKMFPRDEAREILKQGFNHHPEVTPEALSKVGTADDLLFLEEKLQRKYKKKFIYKEIEKAIRKIKQKYK